MKHVKINVAFVIMLVAASQLYGAAEPIFTPSSWLPNFAWQKPLTNEEARRFISEHPFVISSLAKDELIVWHTSKGPWQFAQIESIDPDTTINCWRYDPTSRKTELWNKKFDTQTFHKLSPFWKHVLQKSINPTDVEKEIGTFNSVNRTTSSKPHANAQILPLGSHIMINGDIHGDMKSLAANLVHITLIRSKNFFVNANGTMAKNVYLLFTGDIGDRGPDDVQCWNTILELSNKNQGKVFITRGNHEYENISQDPEHGGFMSRFQDKISYDVWQKMVDVWSKLPHFVLLGIQTPSTQFYDFIMAAHAGFDTNWNMKELIDPTCKSPVNHMISIDLPADVKTVNYNWSDLLPQGYGEAALETQKGAALLFGARGAGEDRINHAMVRTYCRKVSKACSSESHSCALSAILRGHEHQKVSSIGNIGKLIDHPSTPWKALTSGESYPLSEHYDAYTFIAARNIASVGADSRWNAYGILRAKPNGRWYLEPVKFQ